MENKDLMNAMGQIKVDYIKEAAENRAQKQTSHIVSVHQAKAKRGIVKLVGGIAAAFLLSVALPNTTPQVAHAMQELPGIGSYFKLVTFRNYSYESKTHSADVSVSKVKTVKSSDKTTAKQAQKSTKAINQAIAEETNKEIAAFKKSLKEKGYGSLTVKTNVVTNNTNWYVFRLSTTVSKADSMTTSQYYVLSKKTGKQVTLSGMFKSGYRKAFSKYIIAQMEQAMKKDKNKSYFIKAKGDIDGFSQIKAKQNFYINKKNQLVIVFDQGEVGPMSMGAQSFVIPSKLVAKWRK